MKRNKKKLKMKAYIDKSNVILTNRKFKGFEYSEDEKSLKEKPNLEYTSEFKIPALEFFRVIEYLDKNKIESIILDFDSELKKLIIKADNSLIEIEIKMKVNLINDISSKSKYSVEYLKTFFKRYKVSELKGKEIKIKMADEHPLNIELNKDFGILAPIIIGD